MKYVLAAVLLLLAAIFPNVRHSMHRAKELRTMADIRIIATAWESRAEVLHRYAVQDLRNVPRTDGWGTPFELRASGSDYSIRSYGRNRRRDDDTFEGPNTNFAGDIIYRNGAFAAYPDGI